MFTLFNNKRLFHPDTVRYITQLASARPNFVHQKRIDEFVLGLKQDNNWSHFDRLWIFAHPVQALSLVSLVNPTSTQITEVNSPAWVANQGYTSNGTTSYLNSNFIPSTHGVNYVLNSGSVGAYTRTNIAINGVEVSCYIGGNRINLSARMATNVFLGNINADTASTLPSVDSRGLFAAARTASNLTTGYRNGSSFGTIADVSTTLPTIALYILSQNNNGTPGSFSTREISMVFIGSGNINQLKLFLRIERYMDQLNSGVM